MSIDPCLSNLRFNVVLDAQSLQLQLKKGGKTSPFSVRLIQNSAQTHLPRAQPVGERENLVKVFFLLVSAGTGAASLIVRVP